MKSTRKHPAHKPLAYLLSLTLFLTIMMSEVAAQPHFPLVDVHVHTSPQNYPLLLDVLSATGVTRFVNLSGGTPGRGLEKAIAGAEQFPGRILVCANLEWRKVSQPGFGRTQAKMLKLAYQMGARCLKISKALGLSIPSPAVGGGLLRVDAPILDPVWRAAGALGMPVFIHTGDPKAFFEPISPHNERYDELSVHPNWSFASNEYPSREALLKARERVFQRHRSTTFIGVHFANNPEDPSDVDRQLKEHPNLYVDIAARVPELGRHPPEVMRALFTRYQDRILFGTDLGFSRSGIMLGSVGRERPKIPDIFLFYAQHFEWFETNLRQIQHPTPIQGRWRIDAIGLTSKVLEKVYRLNALKLLWGLESPNQIDQDALEQSPGMVKYFD